MGSLLGRDTLFYGQRSDCADLRNSYGILSFLDQNAVAFLFQPGDGVRNGLKQVSWFETQFRGGFCVVKTVIAL